MFQNFIDDHVAVAEGLTRITTLDWQADGRVQCYNQPGLHPGHAQYRVASAGHSNSNREAGIMIGTVGIQDGIPNGQLGELALSYEVIVSGRSVPPIEMAFIAGVESTNTPTANTKIVVDGDGTASDFYNVGEIHEGGFQTRTRGKILVNNVIKSSASNIDCKTWYAGIRFFNHTNTASNNYAFFVGLGIRLVTEEYQPFQPSK